LPARSVMTTAQR